MSITIGQFSEDTQHSPVTYDNRLEKSGRLRSRRH